MSNINKNIYFETPEILDHVRHLYQYMSEIIM